MLALALAASTGWAQSARSSEQCALPRDSGFPGSTGLVHTCAPAQLAQRSAAVQFLVDGSGSMAGFGASTPRLYEWVDQSVSMLRHLGMSLSGTRACYFAAGQGISGCASRLAPGVGMRFAGNTNLHEAIASATGYDVTLILTDGVAASGAGTGDCAGGVDAACVARALRQALTPRAGDRQTPSGGLWILPIASLYKGLFFTEQILANDAFDGVRAAATVREDTATNGELGRPQQRQGRLVYEYTGPRMLFLVVLSREAETGRALAAALAARASGAQITRIARLKDYRSGIALMPPVEVFPGAVPGPAFSAAKLATHRFRPAVCGVMDVSFRPPSQLRLDCPDGAHDGVVELNIARDDRASQCVDMAVLPISRLALSGSGARLVAGQAWSADVLSIKMHCAKGWNAPCDHGAETLEWTLRPNYSASADQLAGQAASPAALLIRSLSTDDPAHHPVRAAGVATLFEKFYREIALWQVVLAYGDLRVCRS